MNSTMNARISECSVQAACGMSAGQTAASPAAIRVRSLADADPAAALDDDELGRVRAGVRLDPRVPRERELGDGAAAVGVDDLAGQPDRADRAVRTPVADAETADLDRHAVARR